MQVTHNKHFAISNKIFLVVISFFFFLNTNNLQAQCQIANAGPNQTVCISAPTAVMAANAATVGLGTWTKISGSGAITSINNPATTITGLTVGNSVFMWTITSGTCTTSSNMTITTNALPTVANAGAAQTVCTSAAATMAGNAPLVGTGLWTLIGGSGTITTPTLNNTTITGLGTGVNIFRWTISNPPCASSSANVTITGKAPPTISNAGPNQTVCVGTNPTMAANAAGTGVGLWVKISGSGAITAPNNPATTITGLTAGTTVLTWSISNPPCASSISNITITTNAPPTAANAGPAQNVCTSSAATMAGNNPLVGTGLWTLVSGSGTITTPTLNNTTITSLGVGANVFKWTTSNPPCASSSANVTITGFAPPTISNAGPNQTVCVGTNPTMAANAATVGVGTWTKLSGSGAITSVNNPATTITGLTAGTTVLQWSIANGPCAASTSQMTITTNAPPTAANAGPAQNVCTSGAATMAGNNPLVGTGLWTLVSGSGTITTPTLNNTTITSLGVGANVFKWTTSNPPCASSSANVTITGFAPPTISNAGPNQTICVSAPTATMAATAATAGLGTWTKLSGSGAITSVNNPSTTITGLTVGTTVLQWSIANAPCAPSVSTMTITTNAPPTVANAGPAQNVCTSSAATMAGNNPLVGTGLWTLVSGSGTITTPTLNNTTITSLGVGANVFKWTTSNPPCASSSANVTITGIAPPTISNAGPNQTVCVGTNPTMAANAPGVGLGTWTKLSGSGAISSINNPATTITGLTAGTTVLQWSIANAPCAPSVSQMTITTNAPPTVANAGPAQNVCTSSAATMAGNNPLVGTGLWTLVSGSGTITTPTLNNTTITSLGVGANVFKWTTSNPPCASSSANVTITGIAPPTISNAGPNQTVCVGTNPTMAANAPGVGLGTWSILSGPGVITALNNPATTITGLTAGTTVLQWSISNAPCASSISQMTITTNAPPTVANAGPNQNVCTTSSVTMAANLPVVGTGGWTLLLGSGTITNSLSPTTFITGIGVGTNVFRWTISNPPCAASFANVTIVGIAPPTISNAGPDQTICVSNPSVTMAANSPSAGNGAWTLISGSGIITNSLSPITSITGLGLGTNIFQWEISNNPCSPSSSTVAISVEDIPTIANAGSSQTICISSPNTTMAANTATVGFGSWTLISGSGTITNSLSPSTTITGLGIGNNIFQWQISNPPCANSTSTMAIIVNDIPTIANAGPSQTICISAPNVIMAANTATVGIGVWSLVSGSGTITNSLSPTTSITGLGLGTNVFAWTISNSPCANSVSNVSIVVKDVPNVSDAGIDQIICISNPTTTLSGNSPIVGVGAWSLVSGSGIITNSLSASTSVTGLALGTNVFAWTISNPPCAASIATVAVNVNNIPSVSNAGPNQTLCISSPNVAMAANFPAVGTGVWSLVSGSGAITNSLSPTTSITGLGLGINVFAWTISNAPCANSVSNVTITVNQVPTVANAGASQTLCISSPNTFMSANTAAVGTGAWTLISGAGTITNSLSPTTAITGLAIGTNIFQWQISNLPCANSTSTMAIIVNDVPTIANAGSNQTLCISSPTTIMAANPPTVGTGIWTLISGSGTITSPNNSSTTITGLTIGTNIFQWEISNSPCANSTSTMAIDVNDVPTISNAGPNQIICLNVPNAVMAANNPIIGSGAWTFVSGSGTITNSLSPTTSVTGFGLGINILAWTISNSPCAQSVSNVTITVNAAPTTALAGPNQTICISSPNTTMAANSPAIGTGAWSLVSGSGTITNPAMPNTTITGLGSGVNVFAWTISDNPCVPSVSNVTITVNNVPTIANAGLNQTLCISSPTTSMTANTATVGTGVWTLVSGSGTITSPNNPFTTITGLAIGTNVFQWTISNLPCANSTSTMVIIVNDIPTIANAGTSQTLCISSPTTIMTANTASVGTGVWTLVSGSGTITSPNNPFTTITGLAIGTNIFQWTISNLPCANSTSTMAITVNDIPTIANAGASQTLCISSPTTIMSANSATVGAGIWTLVSGSGIITNPNLSNSAITGLAIGTNIFQWEISNLPCANSTSTMAIVVNDVPTIANAGANQTLCISSPATTMTANTAIVGTGVWTLISGTGTITNPNNPATTITGLAIGTNIFQWEISNLPCANSTSTMAIIINDVPTIANAGSNQTLCISSPTTIMAANTATVGAGIWTLISGSGTITNSLSPTTSITGLAIGINIFQWEISNLPCANSTSTMSIIVNDVPTIANAGSDQTLCISSPTTIMSANSATVGAGIWTLVSGSGIITNPNLSNSAITGLAIGTNIFQWEISNLPCANSTSTMAIVVNDVPTIANAGANQTLCISSPTTTMTANTATVGTGVWTLISGTGTITNPNNPATTITGLAIGTNIFQWEISNLPCANSTSTMAIVVNDVPTIANAGSNQTLCISSPTTIMAANTATVGAGIWTLISGSGTITNSLSPTTSITGLAIGTNIFQWEISNLPCANSTSTMTITVDDIPTAANAGSAQNLCAPNSTLNANAPLVGIGLWTVIAGGSSITTPTLNNSTVSGLITGTNTMVWTISNGVCPASSGTLNVYVNPFPTPAAAGIDQAVCTPTANLNGNNPTIGFGTWSILTGTSAVTTPTLGTSGVTNLSNGANTFVWTTSYGACPNNSDTVIIFRDSLPTNSYAGLNQTICSATVALNANSPLVGIGTWSVLAGGSSVTTPTLNTSGVTTLATGNNIFEWSIVNGVCPASTSTVSVFVDSYPTISNAGPDLTICASTSTLNANLPLIGTGMWAVISGTSSVTTPTLNNSLVTSLSSGTNTLLWTISNGTCPSSIDTVNIQVDDFASPVNAGTDQAFCLTTTTANLNATIPAIGVTTWSVMSGSGIITNPNSNTSPITGLTPGTNSLVWTNTNGVCPATSDTVDIILLMFPTPANAGPDQIICPTATALAANLPAIGSGNWSVVLGVGSVDTPALNNSNVSGLSTGTNSLVWTTTNGNCPTSSDTVLINVLPPVQQAYAGHDTTIYVTSFTVNGNLPISGTGVWQFVGGSYNIANVNQNLTQLTSLVPGVNTIKWTITEMCGTTEDDINITLVILEIPNAISPNGDGVNDYLEIPVSDYYSNVEVKIMNRWGGVVYENRSYKNTWNGVNQDNAPLAEDTYFYIIKLDEEVKTGYIMVKR